MAKSLPPPSVQAIAESVKRMVDSPVPDSIAKNLAKKIQKEWKGQINLDWLQAIPQRRTPVINATGIILHTNLGRAPLGEKIMARVSETLKSYINLEINLSSGERGGRSSYLDALLETINPHYKPIWVNNNAAAIFLALNTIKKYFDLDKMVISRGELVEIGGGFRIPEIMEEAGFKLIEVGTTNKTTLKDYKQAVKKDKAVICKVHPSNFKISGFTENIEPKDLIEISQKNKCPLIYDAGTFTGDELKKIPPGFDVITLSTDKTLGGCQGGLILTTPSLQKEMLKNPFYRALRLDKISLVILEAILEAHGDKKDRSEIPVSQMMNTPLVLLQSRALDVCKNEFKNIKLEICSTSASFGGGSWPGESWASVGIQITTKNTKISANKVVDLLRKQKPVVISSVISGRAEINLAAIQHFEIPNVVVALMALDKRLATNI